MNLDKIDKNNLIYNILRAYVSWFHNTLFYRRTESFGFENIKNIKSGIIAPNHQNALMDPLAILFTLKKRIAFVARADIFAKPILIHFLLFIKMLPIYRIRDGKASLALNEKIFKKSIDLLEKAIPLTVFPEATHSPMRSLLPLKKGIFRIAFAAEEHNDFNLDLQIYPAGIIFSNYFNYRTDLLVNYGSPIALKDYEKEYKENKPRAMQHIRKDLTVEIKKLALHIKNKDYYDFYEICREVFNDEAKKILKIEKNKSLNAKFKADKFIIDILDNEFENNQENFHKLVAKINNYTQKLSKNKFKDWLFNKPISQLKLISQSIIGILLFPFFLYSTLNFLLPTYLSESILPKFKDKQFHSSLRFVGSLVLDHLFGLLFFTLIWIFMSEWWEKWLYLALQAPTFIIFFWYRQKFKKINAQWRYFFKKKDKVALIEEKNKLIQIFQILVKKNITHEMETV